MENLILTCKKCGNELETSIPHQTYPKELVVEVEPCPVCLKEQKEDIVHQLTGE